MLQTFDAPNGDFSCVRRPRSNTPLQALTLLNEPVFLECARADGTGLFTAGHSAAVARDMDTIRAALGESTINITAESYGGITATAYARQYPHRVRALHLDGTVDHTSTDVTASAAANERMLDRFAAWCASDPACPLRGLDVRRTWRSLIRQVDRDPLPVNLTVVLQDRLIAHYHVSRAGS